MKLDLAQFQPEQRKALNLISLGAGVQSSTLSLMAAKGFVKPMPDGAIFADTKWEPPQVYAWLDWLEKQLGTLAPRRCSPRGPNKAGKARLRARRKNPGTKNSATGRNSVVAGGATNTAQGLESVIGGGHGNRIDAHRHSVISGGFSNRIYGTTESERASMIGGGENGIITNSSAHSFIAAGLSNVIAGARYSFVGGWRNMAGAWEATLRSNIVIAGGAYNTNQTKNSFIGGGYENKSLLTNNLPEANQEANVIVGGYKNTVQASYASSIAGGVQNSIIGPGNDFLYGYHFIGAGFQNYIGKSGYYHVIGGGNGNRIGSEVQDTYNHGFIGSGENNLLICESGTIGGGIKNKLTGTGGVIGGGTENTNQADNAFIGGGYQNWITTAGGNGAIPGGLWNKVATAGGFVLGNGGTNSGPEHSVHLVGNDGNFDEWSNAQKSLQDFYGFTMLGSTTVAVTNKTTTYTAKISDHIILASASGGAFTVTLPAASARKGVLLHIKKSDASGNAVTVSRAGSDTIQGATTVSLAAQYAAVTLYSDGSATWYKYAANQ